MEAGLASDLYMMIGIEQSEKENSLLYECTSILVTYLTLPVLSVRFSWPTKPRGREGKIEKRENITFQLTYNYYSRQKACTVCSLSVCLSVSQLVCEKAITWLLLVFSLGWHIINDADILLLSKVMHINMSCSI